jgi:hypothetical protein
MECIIKSPCGYGSAIGCLLFFFKGNTMKLIDDMKKYYDEKEKEGEIQGVEFYLRLSNKANINPSTGVKWKTLAWKQIGVMDKEGDPTKIGDDNESGS